MDTKKRGSHETRNGLHAEQPVIYTGICTLDTLNCVAGMTIEEQKEVAKKMYYSLCSELSDIARRNKGDSLGDSEEFNRVEEILDLTALIKKEYDLDFD